MKNRKLAKRYAKALLLIGKEDGQIQAYRSELEGFSALLDANPNLASALCNPVYDAADRAKVLSALLDKLSYSKTMSAFISLVFEKGRINAMGAISEAFAELADEQAGVARAKVTSASELTEETVEQIRQALSRMTGKQVELSVEKDPALIGGLVTRIGDLVLDGSVRTQLRNLKESLKRSEAV